MVANPNDTRAVVTVENPPLDLQLSWNVRTGSCDGDGTRIAPQNAFPTLKYEDDVLTANVLIFRRIDTVGTHAAEVYAGSDATGELLACADLLQVDAPSGL